MEAIIFAIILTYAVKKSAEWASEHWQGSKAANRRSTRGKSIPKRAASAVQHDVGYWAHQVLHGFPQIRHGLASGWHEGRAAQLDGRAERQKARTSHLEGRASLLEQIREHRKRREEARGRIRAARQPEPGPDGDPPGPDDQETSGRTEDSGGTPEGTSPGTSPQRPEQDKPAVRDEWTERIARLKKEEEQETPGQQSPAQPPRQEGDRNVSETTYGSVTSQMDQAAADAEQYTAEAEQAKTVTEEHASTADQAQQAAQSTSEDMDALGVDSGTRAAMDEHQAALADAKARADQFHEDAAELEKAWQKVAETAANVKAALTSGHGALNEAHADAPEGGAEKSFYTADK